ncbi:hypothetical protein ACFL6I_05260 [candidate division KSB1 bacterium]
MKIAIVDKTVLTPKGQEHRSLNWVLRHRKYVKPNNLNYKVSTDYFGFFPKENNKFEIHDLSYFKSKELDSIADYYDMAYIADMYGIYYNEWYLDSMETEHSRIVYGGLHYKDYLFLKRMKERNKLIILEFNCLGSPTSTAVRNKTEELFGLRWTGWTLRYFDSLDTLTNAELPNWVIENYMEQHNNEWPFTKAGIVFVYEYEHIFILENETHLTNEIPLIHTGTYGQEKYNLPQEFTYPYWIDITRSLDSSNREISTHEVMTNSKGDSILAHYNVPHSFPAVMEHLDNYRFYYFAGDFCDNIIPPISAYFRGVTHLKRWLVDRNDYRKRSAFFWNYYYPMMEVIMNDYYKSLSVEK